MSPPLTIETDREADGRWIADVPALPGCLAHRVSCEEAVARAKALALHGLAALKRIGWAEIRGRASRPTIARIARSARPTPEDL